MEWLKGNYKTELTRVLLIYVFPLEFPSLSPLVLKWRWKVWSSKESAGTGRTSSIAFLSVLQMGEGFPQAFLVKGQGLGRDLCSPVVAELLSAWLLPWGTRPASRFFPSELEWMAHPEGAELRHERETLKNTLLTVSDFWGLGGGKGKQREAQLVALLLFLCLLMTWKLLVLC